MRLSTKMILLYSVVIAAALSIFLSYTIQSTMEGANKFTAARFANMSASISLDIQQDIDMMQKELDHRKLELMPELIEEVKRTRAFGDLSENFEYKAAKQAQNRNRSRIRYLERMIKSAHVIEDKAGADEVGLFDKVELLFEDDEDTETVQVVTTVRCDPLSGRISCKAPLGKALLGRKAGDEVSVTTEEGGSYTVRIKSITKEEDNGDGPIL